MLLDLIVIVQIIELLLFKIAHNGFGVWVVKPIFERGVLTIKYKIKMENKTRKAKVKATGQVVEVYRLQRGGWCNLADCKTEYKEEDLQFID